MELCTGQHPVSRVLPLSTFSPVDTFVSAQPHFTTVDSFAKQIFGLKFLSGNFE